MIKNLKIELVLLVLLVAVIYIFSQVNSEVFSQLYKEIYLFDGVYLKKFFSKITNLGDSLWVFILTITVLFVSWFFKVFNALNQKYNYKKLQTTLFFLLTSTIVSGLLTQILKHIFGRVRPNHLTYNDFPIFNFFSLDSSFHSFPSGHTSTIFIVAFFLNILIPRLKFYFVFFALLVALSRVVVGAHFVTDVLGGIVVASIGFKITLHTFNKFGIKKNYFKLNSIDSNIFFLSLIIFFIGIVFISIGSSLDLFVSDIFYLGNNQFVLQNYHLMTIIIRKLLLPLIILYLTILPLIGIVIPLHKIYFNHKLKNKEVFLIFFSSLFNLIIIVNALLKDNWGRARPNDILELGGGEKFTPWYQLSESCASNCSFVSGDASVGFSIIILFFITKKKIFFWLALSFGLILGMTRILEGGHFLSDIIAAGFLIYILSYFEFKFFTKTLLKNAS